MTMQVSEILPAVLGTATVSPNLETEQNTTVEILGDVREEENRRQNNRRKEERKTGPGLSEGDVAPDFTSFQNCLQLTLNANKA